MNGTDSFGLADDRVPLNIVNCEALNTLIEKENSFGKNLTMLIYNPINFSSNFTALDAAYPSTGGLVSIDWMMRTGLFGFGRIHPLLPRGAYMSAKSLWNMTLFNAPDLNIRGEANWNAAAAYSYWADNDNVTLEQMFAPSLEICKCMK